VLDSVIVPDLWQQEAVSALRAGQDVVVHSPTGAGKTLIFELWANLGKPKGKAVYTVPTRALANDKLSEWRARGWRVGISTGDLSENLDAPILTATLETQKSRLIHGQGPDLLVVDEYQMIGDQDRGLNYELALALAPAHTQLLLLSGSVANPDQVVKWLRRLGRDAVLVKHEVRPVPLEEASPNSKGIRLPSNIKGFWPRFVAGALADDLGPILIFSPRRARAEKLARQIAQQLPEQDPLHLTDEQKNLVGGQLAKMLHNRVAYHHSGLSYGARAGVIEPLAKAGQLRVMVATMGLAAGINFSLRSVVLESASYKRGGREHMIRGDEILQMFGRAGRRGLDEVGYILIGANEVRMHDGFPVQLARSGLIDWSALLGIMHAAIEDGREPFAAAIRVQERLFTTRPITLGVESALEHPDAPCGLLIDAERARHVRRKEKEILNSAGEWERNPRREEVVFRDIFLLPTELREGEAAELREGEAAELRPLLTVPEAIGKQGPGELTLIARAGSESVYGRVSTAAEKNDKGKLILQRWVRRALNWRGKAMTGKLWEQKFAPLLQQKMAERGTPISHFENQHGKVTATFSLEEMTKRVPVDRHGVALWKPPTREGMPEVCAGCELVPVCRKLPRSQGVVQHWRQFGLIEPGGAPTRRGQIVSFFTGGDGLAMAAAIEDEKYPIEDLVYDIANLRGGYRFHGEDDRMEGRLAWVCRNTYGMHSVTGYLDHGAPAEYGYGADSVVADIHQQPSRKQFWIQKVAEEGDIDRVIIEWLSLLRRVTHSPTLEDCPRWSALQERAAQILDETESPTLVEFPPLEYQQTHRLEHRLHLRRR
jgi:superfamily II DNA/RNA helicase